MSIRKLHANLIQTAGKERANLPQKSMAEIFFPKFKSPQKSMGSVKSAIEAKPLTPFGSRGINIISDPFVPTVPVPLLEAPSLATDESPVTQSISKGDVNGQ
jgi:hypothetical protein